MFKQKSSEKKLVLNPYFETLIKNAVFINQDIVVYPSNAPYPDNIKNVVKFLFGEGARLEQDVSNDMSCLRIKGASYVLNDAKTLDANWVCKEIKFDKDLEEHADKKYSETSEFGDETHYYYSKQEFIDEHNKDNGWHDLRKNPNDLPPMIEDERMISDSVWIHVENWGGEVGHFDYRKNAWIVRCMVVNLNVFAWMDLPKFEV